MRQRQQCQRYREHKSQFASRHVCYSFCENATQRHLSLILSCLFVHHTFCLGAAAPDIDRIEAEGATTPSGLLQIEIACPVPQAG